jgi:hypothetical protein
MVSMVFFLLLVDRTGKLARFKVISDVRQRGRKVEGLLSAMTALFLSVMAGNRDRETRFRLQLEKFAHDPPAG